MRTKYLRALGHIRAAHAHLTKARELINHEGSRDAESKFAPLMGALTEARGAVASMYGQLVFWTIKPEGLPK